MKIKCISPIFLIGLRVKTEEAIIITVKFITLGCKTNIYESDAMAQLFENAGYEVVAKGPADICVVNTCTVTGTGAAKSLKQIRRARRENPDAVLAVTGCLAQTEAERLRKAENIDVLIGNKYRSQIVSLCADALAGKKTDKVEDILKTRDFEELGIVHRQRRIRAEIKIEDGCNNFCSYCKIPYARGPVRSRDIANIVEEAKTLGNDGYSEIVLTGIHIGSYGKDLENSLSLIDVMEAVDSASDIPRLRLGSLEPVMITEEFTQRAAKLKSLCHQFHLSLQSGCDKTLSAMRRRYTTEDFKTAVKNLRKAFPDVAITTDLIVGFPGETDADFEVSKTFCEDIGFAQMHIFPYSVREGTAAEKLPDRVSDGDKDKRCHAMLRSAAEMKKTFCEKFIGREMPVLFEQKKGDMWVGMTENYMEVRVKSEDNLKGKTINIAIAEYDEENEYLK